MKENDISPVLAISLLALVVFMLFGFKYKVDFLNLAQMAQFFIENNQEALSITAISILFNLFVGFLAFERILGFKKQGSRLRNLKKERSSSDLFKKLFITVLSCTLAYYVIGYYFGDYFNILIPYFKDASIISLSINTGFISYLLIEAYFKIKSKTLFKKSLPSGFNKSNAITLGSINEESKELTPEWSRLNKRALNGNILVTGSIGTGKTQGTILTYTKQLFSNFENMPSALVLDPKGSFIPKVKEILSNLKNDHHCLSLGNCEQTFNPVYIEDPLKNSNFLEITSMIRAAAKNFSGKSNESPIWEDSAFNFTKNVVIYCAATMDYFTLTDCYEVMLKADEEKTIEDLKACVQDNKFDGEEKYNIVSAINYFKEFQSFEDKFKSGVLVSSTTFLNQFQEYKAAKIFCPTKESLTIRSMDEIIDEGKVLLFHTDNEALSKSMGTFVKLHYQKSVLNRLKDSSRESDHLATIIADEYQDLVSIGTGGSIGDDKVCAKGREAGFFFLAATQSLNSLFNAIGNEKAAKELIQNFRTRIACHSSDIETIRNFKELMGKTEAKRTNHSISENSHKAKKNYLLGGFDSKEANISESFSTSTQKEDLVTGKEFSRLKSFEAFAQIYDGVGTSFHKLYLKPYFLKNKRLAHTKVLKMLEEANYSFSFIKIYQSFVKAVRSSMALRLVPLFLISTSAFSFPNICSVVNSSGFNSCLNFNYQIITCGFPPRPCARISYNVPQTFIEVSDHAGESYFYGLPAASTQLATSKNPIPFGAVNDEDTQSYHARTVSVPFANIPFRMLPCGGTRTPKMCFDVMSEHLTKHWSTGKGDRFQPNFLAWLLSPKACLIKGAALSASGSSVGYSSDSPKCSVKLPSIFPYPVSSRPACNGWGTFYPRMGSYNGPSSLTGALMIGSRIKSLGEEVTHSTPRHPAESWQMISPNSSSCFKEGQNLGLLETAKGVRETNRIFNGKLKGHLFVTWKPVSCVRDLPYIGTSLAAIASMNVSCKGLGGSF